MRLIEQLFGYCAGFIGRTHVVLVPIDSAHADQIYNTYKLFFRTNWQLHWHGIRTQAFPGHFHDPEEIGTRTIHLVDKNHPRDVVLVALTPDRLRLRLHAADRAQNRYGTVKYTQTAFHFDREINVPRRINNIDAVLVVLLVHALPEASGCGGCDRDTAFLLLFHPVHNGSAIVNFAYLVRDACVEQYALGRGRLARIDMGHNANIAVTLDGGCTGHDKAVYQR